MITPPPPPPPLSLSPLNLISLILILVHENLFAVIYLPGSILYPKWGVWVMAVLCVCVCLYVCVPLSLLILSFLFSDVLSGYNGTIFAYGQTSSGKTHTMEVSRQSCFRMIPSCIANFEAEIQRSLIAKCRYKCTRNVLWCQGYSSHIHANHKTSNYNNSKQTSW